jgi:hypothetical protein
MFAFSLYATQVISPVPQVDSEQFFIFEYESIYFMVTFGSPCRLGKSPYMKSDP